MPPILPIRTAAQTSLLTLRLSIRKYEEMINKIADPIVPVLSADSGDLLEDILTTTIPMIEQINPREASAKGKNMSSD